MKKVEIFIAGDCVDFLNHNILTINGITGSTIIPANGYWINDNNDVIEEQSYIIVIIAPESKVSEIKQQIALCVYDQDCVLVTISEVDSQMIYFNK